MAALRESVCLQTIARILLNYFIDSCSQVQLEIHGREDEEEAYKISSTSSFDGDDEAQAVASRWIALRRHAGALNPLSTRPPPGRSPHTARTQPAHDPHPNRTHPARNPYPTCTRPSPNPLSTRTQPTLNPHSTSTQPALNLDVARTQPAQSLHQTCTQPAPKPHPPRIQPVSNLHPHSQPAPNPPHST